jgi:heat-inducible transcriptional repressor
MSNKAPSSAPGLKSGGRHGEVLKSIIREHIVTGEPVGSQTVSRARGLKLSPASIRNIMAELEEWGLLDQPYTSAGRVPTDKAYRLYVDQLIPRPRMAASQAQVIDQALFRSRQEIPDLLGEASRQLSQFSNQVGLVLAPDLTRIIVEHLEFVRLDEHRVVAILVARSGVVHNRMLRVDNPLEQSELDRIGRYLSAEFGGRTLPEMRELLRRMISEERARYDRLVARSLELGRQAIESEDLVADLFVEGVSNLIGSPEFAELDVIRSVFKTLEEKRTLIDLLTRVLRAEGVQVVIGEENPLSDLARCSLVASPYGVGTRVMGTVGIVGPRRMEYARAIALVDYLARVLTRLLSDPGN